MQNKFDNNVENFEQSEKIFWRSIRNFLKKFFDVLKIVCKFL